MHGSDWLTGGESAVADGGEDDGTKARSSSEFQNTSACVAAAFWFVFISTVGPKGGSYDLSLPRRARFSFPREWETD